jgi:biotin carboxyl carrier protein
VRFTVQIDDADHRIVAGADGRLMVDADTFEAKVTRSAADRLMVQLGEKSYEVRVIENSAETGAYLLELSGERIPVAVTDVTRGGTAAVRAAVPAVVGPSPSTEATAPATPVHVAGEGIRAPMPGRIVDVLVQVDDTVETGDVVLILEAMKMENELRAPRRGTVTSVLVKKGDPAEGGQLLVTLE